MARTAAWDAELYEARHSFVFKYGEDLIELLDPKPGESILDLGCGPGQLTAKIAERGVNVVGLDASPEMIGQARQNYPKLRFVLEDATRMTFNGEFDAVFSNAALHWMLDASAVARCISNALRQGGRFVAELGGRRNVIEIESAIRRVVAQYIGDALPPSRTFYPSVAQYSGILEAHNLEVRYAVLFDRLTLLEGDRGMENWIRQFKWYYIEALPTPDREEALSRIVEALRPVLFREGHWYADYRRLRITASKV